MPQFEVYRRDDGKWAWRLRAGNGRIVATDGGQGYDHEADCRESGRAVVDGLYSIATKRASVMTDSRRWPCLECGEPIGVDHAARLGQPRYVHLDPVVFASHTAVRGADAVVL